MRRDSQPTENSQREANSTSNSLGTSGNLVLALSLLGIEFIAGMHVYLLATVVPLVARDLEAYQYYGAITAAAQVAMFLTMPLGSYLLRRIPVNKLLLYLTGLSLIGAITSALSPTIAVFLAGRVISGLAAGALATVSLAVIVTVLPTSWRRRVLAGYALMWVVTSLVGPLYASWISGLLNWRWALVIYLPLLLIARAVISRQLQGTMTDQPRSQLALGAGLALAGGVALVSLTGLTAIPSTVAVGLGLLGMAVALTALRRLLPPGVFPIQRGRPAAIAAMGLLAASYFGAAATVPIVVHDVLSGSTGAVAAVLTGGGLSWALLGIIVNLKPANAPRHYARRATWGTLLIAVGIAIMMIALLGANGATSIGMVAGGWLVAGIGMGMTYVETLNHIVDSPIDDGVVPAQAASAAIIVEALPMALAATIGTALLGRSIGASAGAPETAAPTAISVLAVMATLALATGVVARRVPRSGAS